jgi:hypothetical protein
VRADSVRTPLAITKVLYPYCVVSAVYEFGAITKSVLYPYCVVSAVYEFVPCREENAG